MPAILADNFEVAVEFVNRPHPLMPVEKFPSEIVMRACRVRTLFDIENVQIDPVGTVRPVLLVVIKGKPVRNPTGDRPRSLIWHEQIVHGVFPMPAAAGMSVVFLENGIIDQFPVFFDLVHHKPVLQTVASGP